MTGKKINRFTWVLGGFLLLLLGQFGCGFPGGTPLEQDVDLILYAPAAAGNVTMEINGNPVTLQVGEKLLVENLKDNSPSPSPPTCIYGFSAQGGPQIHAGYDPWAVEEDPPYDDKYTPAEQADFENESEYQVTVIRREKDPEKIALEYGLKGKISAAGVEFFGIRAAPVIPKPTEIADTGIKLFGTDTEPGSVHDRTLCFVNAIDPFVIEIAALPTEPSCPPVAEPSLEEKSKVQVGGEAEGGGDSGGKSGCSLQTNLNRYLSWDAWLWILAATLAAGLGFPRKKYEVI